MESNGQLYKVTNPRPKPYILGLQREFIYDSTK